MDTFVPIPNFDGYFINKNGDVLSKRRYKEGRILMKSSLNSDGYYYLCMYYNNNERKPMKVHRLLALTFIPNPDNLPCVDHIDKCRTNNKLENLRWASRALNSQNATRRKDNKIGHKNICLDVDKRTDKDYIYYRFDITRNGKRHKKRFKTLEEAISYRDEYITNLGEEIID